MKQSINLRQASCIAGLLVFANKVLVLPSLLFEKVGVDAIFILVGLFLVDIAMISVFFKLKKAFPNTSFFDILSRYLTRYGATFIYIIICAFFLMKALTTYNASLMYLKNQVYFEVGEYIFLICFLAITNNLALRGIRSTARTTEFFYFIIIGLILFSTYAMCSNFTELPVLFNKSFGEIFRSSFSYVFSFGDTLFLFLIMDKIDMKKSKKRTLYIFVIFNMILTFILHGVFFSVFKYSGFMHNNAASDVITFSNNFAGVGRIDIISVIVIMFLSYFQLAFYNIAFDVSFSAIFPKGKKFYSVIIYDILFLSLLYFVITDYTKAFVVDLNYMPYFAIVLQYLVPLICLIGCMFMRRGKNE